MVAVLVAALLGLLALPALAANITGTLGDDHLIGTPDQDEISGLKGNDLIQARGSFDIVKGNSGEDELYAENGDDYVVGGYHQDNLYGQAGNDILIDDGDNLFVDELYCGEGNDTAYADPQDLVHSSCETVNPPYDPPIYP
jgi:Ca2+-binding RTX toxin-like protein